MPSPSAAPIRRRTPSPPPADRGADRRRAPAILFLLLAGSLAINLWGNRWGAPNPWHPDELTPRAMTMVYERDPNPHFFIYGGVHYYTLIAGAILPVKVYETVFDPEPPADATPARERWLAAHDARVFQMGRSVSALLSTLLVGITYLLAATLFGRRVGLLAGILLAVSTGFVWLAHFATVDPAANFWYWLACLFAVLLYRDGRTRWYVLAALVAGIAIGTKADRLTIVVPLILAHALRDRGLRPRRLFLLAGLVPAGFVLANPALLFAPFEFVDGFSREMFFSIMREGEEGVSYLLILGLLRNALGWPLFALALAAVGYALLDIARGRDRPELILLFATFLPYYLLFGTEMIPSWYVVLFLPALGILTARMAFGLAESLPRPVGRLSQAALGAAVLVAALRTASLLAQFTHDSRYGAAAWIEAHVPAGASVAMLPRGPVLPADRFRVVPARADLAWLGFAIEPRERLTGDPTYRSVRAGILAAEHWAGRTLGTAVRTTPYQSWFDSIEEGARDPAAGESILSDAEYEVVIHDKQPATLRALSSPASGYRKVASFHYTVPGPLEVEFEFVNLRASIWRRTGSRPPPPPGSA